MTITAFGVDAERQRDGTIVVRARIVDSETDKGEFITVADTTLDGCKAQLLAEVNQREVRARDEALRASVVGQILATSEGAHAG